MVSIEAGYALAHARVPALLCAVSCPTAEKNIVGGPKELVPTAELGAAQKLEQTHAQGQGFWSEERMGNCLPNVSIFFRSCE